MKPTIKTERYELYLADCMNVLPTLESGSVDAVIVDPPYSSGGFTRSDRMADPDSKYTQSESQGRRPQFLGDNRDQRSWCYWVQMWLSRCLEITKVGGYGLVFCDWRQLPTMTDAFQGGGWQWRGLISWDKGPSARAPHKGYFRHQCEYIVWGSAGPLKAVYELEHPGPFPGSLTIPVLQDDKFHLTGKPTELMKLLVECSPVGGTVLDGFMGSGTTGVAALDMGRYFIGIEKDPTYFEIAAARIAKAAETPPLFEMIERAEQGQLFEQVTA